MSALALAKSGWQVTLVDAGVTGGESSWAGGGILFPLLPWKYGESVNRLALAGAAAYPALSEQLLATTGIDPQYQVSGIRVLADFGGDVALAWCRAHGVTAELSGGDLWLPAVAQARNPRLMQALRASVEVSGIQLMENTGLLPLRESGGKINRWISTDGRHLEADIFVLTAGAWSTGLLGVKAKAIQVKPMRGQMLLYQLPPGTLQHLLYHDDFYLIPRRDGHILAGSTVEDVGFDKSTTAAAAADLHRKAGRLLPALADAPIIKHWSGLRPGSPDNIPVIARHPDFDNLYLNTGHFRYGITMAPASAEILAAQVGGETLPAWADDYAFPREC
ncbi:MAG TPA: FAD-dependent oxidoreductase [Methylophilaceae bacterium]|nr:FAD-dependent oxidoreductase [Methylophilaceae bacterium]